MEEKKRQANNPMNAEQGTLIQVGPQAYETDHFDYTLIVHSPKDHQFKIYGIRNTSSEEGDFPQPLDLQPGRKLIPPIDDLLNSTIWHLEQFFVSADLGWEGTQLWLRARSGAICKTFMMTFDMLDGQDNPKDLHDSFSSGWSVVDSSSLTTDKLRQLPDFQGLEAITESTTTPSEKWLEFLFFPGRYSPASLETALYIYRKGRNLPATSGKGLKAAEEPLKERITSAVAAKILLRRLTNDQPDYDRYQSDLQAQWVTFFSLLSHLHNRRHESIGSAFDSVHGLAWTVCADFVAPVRVSSKYDLLSHNAELCMSGAMEELAQPIDEAIWGTAEDVLRTQILAVAKQFRSCLSPTSQENLRTVATTTALEPTEDVSPKDGLQLLYDRCGFVSEISDDDFEALESAATQFQGLGTLSDDSFLAVLEVLDAAPEPHGPHANLTLGRYGKDVNIAIAQESIQQMQSALLDVLALIIFMAYELDENDLSTDFRPTEMYESFMQKIQVIQLRLWLVRHVRQEPMRASAKHSDMISMSIYESLFAGDWTIVARRKDQSESMSSLLTTWASHWTFGLDLIKHWSDITTWAMADLLRHKEIDLAADFVKFLPENDSGWATYLKARLHLATGEYAQASLAFTDASHDMASAQNANANMKGDLLTPEDHLLIGKGPSPYFQHVLALFDKLKVYSYTADFASLALQYMPSRKDIVRHFGEVDMRKSKTDSPAIETVRNSGQEIKLMQQQQTRDDILGRLFNALVQTGRFENAYATLTEMMDPMIKRSNLRILVKACTKRNDPTGASVLLNLGIEGDLLKYADSILLELARDAMSKSPAITSSAAPAYHQILFSFRTSNGDFRGAAAILYEHLERLRNSKGAMAQIVQDPEDETLVRVYALLINTLACCGEQEAWLLADPIEGVHSEGKKRTLVRLEDVRREYMAELDRRNDLAMGRFAIVGDEMDVL
jgi:nuclear pore complex protein Nup160